MTTRTFVEALTHHEPPIKAELRGNIARVELDPVPSGIGSAIKLKEIIFSYAQSHDVVRDHGDPEQDFWKDKV